jgi:hypothetical protein
LKNIIFVVKLGNTQVFRTGGIYSGVLCGFLRVFLMVEGIFFCLPEGWK